MQEVQGALVGRVAVITGAAGGLGRAIAAGMAQAGAQLALIDRDPAQLDDLVGGLTAASHAAAGFACDITDEAAVLAAFAAIEAWAPGIDILVNNAGIARRAPADAVASEDWDAVVAVNMTGAFLVARRAARAMRRRGGGAIVNMASIMGLSGGLYPNVSYQATKGAMVNMTRALAVEWGPDNIRVNALAPTWVRTPLTEQLLSDPVLGRRILDSTPLGRFARPEDLVGPAVFLAGPASAMVTGHVLPVDGGFMAI